MNDSTFFILPDAHAGDAVDEMLISIDGTVRTMSAETIFSLLNAIEGILAEPYGCTHCDSGVPRNPEKGHQVGCPYELARIAIAKATKEPTQ